MAQLAIIKQMSWEVSWGSAGEFQADEQARVALLIGRLSSRWAVRCCAAHLAVIKQMSGQVTRGSAGDYQADERTGVTWLSW